jgi:hypothetical protein
MKFIILLFFFFFPFLVCLKECNEGSIFKLIFADMSRFSLVLMVFALLPQMIPCLVWNTIVLTLHLIFYSYLSFVI